MKTKITHSKLVSSALALAASLGTLSAFSGAALAASPAYTVINRLEQSVSIPSDVSEIERATGDDAFSKTKLSTLCKPGQECLLNGTGIDFSINLGGCRDRLASATYQVVTRTNSDELTLYVSALIARSKASTYTNCVAIPVQRVRIELPNVFVKRVEIVNLNR